MVVPVNEQQRNLQCNRVVGPLLGSEGQRKKKKEETRMCKREQGEWGIAQDGPDGPDGLLGLGR